MNPSPAPPVIRPPATHGWLWGGLAVLLLPLVVLAFVVAAVTSYFRLSSDTRALRNGVMKSAGVEWRQRIALNVGGFTTGAARTGLSFVPLDTRARAALQAVRGVEVGVYELSSRAKRPECAAMLTAADTAMNARGWDRVVGVVDDGKLVAVFVPDKTASARRMKCCVLVFDGRQMVVVSARANLEPLLECAFNQIATRDKAGLPGL